MKNKKTVFILLSIIILSVAGYWYWQTSKSKTIEYLTSNVMYGNIENNVTAVGNVQPIKYVDVGAQISGQIKTIYVKLGQEVKKGKLLALIDPTTYESKITGAKASLDTLIAQKKEQEAELHLDILQDNRNLNLLNHHAVAVKDIEISKAAIQTTKAKIDAIKAQITQAESELDIANTNLSYTKVMAPMSGTIVVLDTREGQTLNANQSTPVVMRIANLNTMTIWAQVSEADISKLKEGQTAYFTALGRGNKKWFGVLEQILPTPETINDAIFYNVLFNVPNLDRELKLEMTVQVFFVLEKSEHSLIVPLSAVQFAKKMKIPKQNKMDKVNRGQAKDRLYILDHKAMPVLREVELGISNSVSIEVKSGLKEGDKVIVGSKSSNKESKDGKPRGRHF